MQLLNFRLNVFHNLLSHLPDSNRGPSLYESAALPTELRWHSGAGYRNRTGATTLGRLRTATIRIPHYLNHVKGSHHTFSFCSFCSGSSRGTMVTTSSPGFWYNPCSRSTLSWYSFVVLIVSSCCSSSSR